MTGDTHRVAAMSSPGRADMVTRSFTTDGSETRGAKGSALCEPQLEKMRENVTVIEQGPYPQLEYSRNQKPALQSPQTKTEI